MEIRALVINVYWRKFYCLSVDRLNRYFYTFVVSFKLYTQITILYYWLCSFLTIYFPNFFLSLFLPFFLFSLFRSFFVLEHNTIFYDNNSEIMIGISGSQIWSKTLMELMFNLCGEFRWNSEVPVSQIHSPHLLVGAPGVFSDLLKCSDDKERVGCGKQREATAPIKSLVKLQPWFLS